MRFAIAQDLQPAKTFCVQARFSVKGSCGFARRSLYGKQQSAHQQSASMRKKARLQMQYVSHVQVAWKWCHQSRKQI